MGVYRPADEPGSRAHSDRYGRAGTRQHGTHWCDAARRAALARLLIVKARRADCPQHSLGDLAWSLSDAPHLGLPATWIHLDDLRPYGNGHAVAGETTKKTIKRCH